MRTVLGLVLLVSGCDDGATDAAVTPDVAVVDSGADGPADAADVDLDAAPDAGGGPGVTLLRRDMTGQMHPVSAGDTLMIEEGWQGGYHVWASLLAVDLGVDPEAYVPFELELLQGGQRVAWYALEDVFAAQDPGPALYAQTVILQVDPESLDGATATLRGSVALDGETYTAQREVALSCCQRLDRPDWEVDGRGADLGVGNPAGPQIVAVEARPAQAAVGEWVALQVNATGADLETRWTASGGELEAATAPRTRWRADQAGVYRLTATVTSPAGADAQTIRVDVGPAR